MEKKTTLIILISIFILAFVLRFLASQHTHILTDETAFAVRSLNFLSSGKYSTVDQAPLHLALVDISERIFGVSGWSSRLPNIFLGAFAIFVIYLILTEFGKERGGLIAAFLFAISPYSTIFNIETDMTSIFFLLLSILFLMKALRKNFAYLQLSFLFLGIAALSKLIALFVFPVYIVAIIYYLRKKKENLISFKEGKIHFNKQAVKVILISLLLLGLALSPILIYNILLYVHKDLVDLIFARSLGIDAYNQFFGEKFKEWSFISNIGIIGIVAARMWTYDMFITITFILGLIVACVQKKKEHLFFLLCILSIVFLLSGTSGSSKSHYIFIIPLMAIISGYCIDFVMRKWNPKVIVGIFLVVAVILSGYQLSKEKIFEKASIIQLREVTKDFEESAVVIVDSRIYTGNIAWNFYDTHYIESRYFPQLLEIVEGSKGQKTQVPIYFIECVPDDCGWGRGLKENKEVQEFNEKMVDLFTKNSVEIKEVSGVQYSFKIYKMSGQLPSEAYSFVDASHRFLFNGVGWVDQTKDFDYFVIKSPFWKLIDWIGRLVFYVTILLSFGSIYLVYRLVKKDIKREAVKVV